MRPWPCGGCTHSIFPTIRDFVASSIDFARVALQQVVRGLIEDRVLARLVDIIGMEPHHAKRFVAGFINGNKRHRARVIELGQPGDELI